MKHEFDHWDKRREKYDRMRLTRERTRLAADELLRMINESANAEREDLESRKIIN